MCLYLQVRYKYLHVYVLHPLLSQKYLKMNIYLLVGHKNLHISVFIAAGDS